MRKIASIFICLLMFLSGCTGNEESPNVEDNALKEGDQIPETTGFAYVNGSWVDYNLSESINNSGNHHVILFSNTDCGYCMIGNSDIESYANDFPIVVVYIMVGFDDGGTGFDSSREEIVAFRNMDDYSGCGNGGGDNCNSRDGNPHNWTYMDDLQDQNMENWSIIGTPISFIVDGDSKLVWHPDQHLENETSDGENLGQALSRILG